MSGRFFSLSPSLVHGTLTTQLYNQMNSFRGIIKIQIFWQSTTCIKEKVNEILLSCVLNNFYKI